VGPFTGLGFREDGRALLQQLGVTFPAGTTIDPEILRAYEVLGVPTTLFVQSNGAVLSKWPGPMPRAKFIQLIRELIETSTIQD
jgi:thioredoxin-related protein